MLSFQACSAIHQTVLSAPFLRSSFAEEPFGQTLTRYRLRTAIDAIASPPLWQRAARPIGTAVGLVIEVSLLLLSFGAEVFDPWGENGLNLLDLLVGGLLVAAVIAAIGGVVTLVGYVADRRATRSATGRHGKYA